MREEKKGEVGCLVGAVRMRFLGLEGSLGPLRRSGEGGIEGPGVAGRHRDRVEPARNRFGPRRGSVGPNCLLEGTAKEG